GAREGAAAGQGQTDGREMVLVDGRIEDERRHLARLAVDRDAASSGHASDGSGERSRSDGSALPQAREQIVEEHRRLLCGVVVRLERNLRRYDTRRIDMRVEVQGSAQAAHKQA